MEGENFLDTGIPEEPTVGGDGTVIAVSWKHTCGNARDLLPRGLPSCVLGPRALPRADQWGLCQENREQPGSPFPEASRDPA